MARRLKMTPFARFVLVMIIAAPIAYLAASYYNGEDGIENLKKLLGIGQTSQTEMPAAPATDTGAAIIDDTATLDLSQLQQAYSELKRENTELKEMLRKQELEIQDLRQLIENLRASSGQ